MNITRSLLSTPLTNKILLISFSYFILLFSCHPRPSANTAAKTNFTTSNYSAAFDRAKTEGLPIFIDFYASWCGPCKQMDREVFTLPKVATLLNESFVAIKVNAEKGEGLRLAREHKVRGYPTLVFLNSEGKTIDRLEGYIPASTLLTYAKKANQKNQKSSTTSTNTLQMHKNINQKRLRSVLTNYIFSQHIGALEVFNLDKIVSSEWLDESEETIKTTYRVKVDTKAQKINEPSVRFYNDTVVVKRYYSIEDL